MILALLAAAAAASASPPPTLAPGPAPTPALAPELWRGARVGMSQAQVAALFPGGRPPAPTVAGSSTTPNAVEGGAAGWASDEEVFGRSGSATYYFQDDRLIEVVVEVLRLRLRHTQDNVQAARAVRTGLTRYYGAPKACVDTARRGLDRLDCHWVTPAVQVGLSYVDYGGLSPALRVGVRGLPGPVHETGATFSRRGATHG